MMVEFETASVNPINETYIETSTVNNVTIMPPNATTGTTINGIETVNATVNILPNGLAIDKGQSLIVTDGDDGTAEQENATTAFVDISRMNPDGTGSGTGVVFFSTNSTGQLAFLNNMVGINQAELSPEGGNIRVWEWKGKTLPFETGGWCPHYWKPDYHDQCARGRRSRKQTRPTIFQILFWAVCSHMGKGKGKI